MPLKPGAAKKAYHAAYMRQRRAAAKQAKAKAALVGSSNTGPSTDVIGDFCRWCEQTLKIPPGHPAAGSPLVIPDFGSDFLKDAMRHRYSLLSMSRKNAKSSLIAAYLLGRLLCPALFIEGYRAGVVSVNREKSVELKMLIQALVEASNLQGVTVWKKPVVEGPAGRIDFLSADKDSGAASGFDDAIIDELGLLEERSRELVNGMRSAISARDGRFLAISVMGRSPFTRELVEQKDDPAVCVHLYKADDDCDLTDKDQWLKANPGLGTIKSLSYMEDESRRVQTVTSDQSDFRAYDLNQCVDPGREMIVTLSDWQKCLHEDAERVGPVVIGFDAGGSSAMTCCSIYWPQSGRLEVYSTFPSIPNLESRGRKDGVGKLYLEQERIGELVVHEGRLVDLPRFIQDCLIKIAGHEVVAFGTDRYRKAELLTALDGTEVEALPVVWRGVGASQSGDGSHDVRAFQRAVVSGHLWVVQGRSVLSAAVAESALRYDGNGNPGLDKASGNRRIDALQSSVIACGIGEQYIHQEAEEDFFIPV